MYGAIIGDLAGSIYEYDQVKKIKKIRINKIIEDNAFYSDDTILTIAIMDAILHDKNYEYYLKKYIKEYSNYHPNFSPYFKSSFSPNMIKWAKNDIVGKSVGNGAMMRISPVAYMFNSEEEVIKNARLTTIPSHNSKEAIEAATLISLLIFYLRKGLLIDDVYKKLNINVEYRPFDKFNTTCKETIGNCLYIVYHSNSFEDAIRKTIFMGGNTDTNACIVGSIAEAIYGIDDMLIKQANEKIPDNFEKVLSKAYKKVI